MAIGKGGQSGNQSSSTQGNYSGTGVNTGLQAGGTRAVAPDYYTSGAEQIAGTQGQTGGQNRAAGYYSGILDTPTTNPIDAYGAYANERPYTLQRMESDYGYKAPSAINAQPITASTAGATRGSDFLPSYSMTAADQVVNPTIDAADFGFAKALNQLKSQFGGAWTAGSGPQVAAGTAAGEYGTGLAKTIGDIRQNVYGTNVGAALSDSSGATGANIANADRSQRSSEFNSQQELDRQKYNSDMANQREQFDVNAAYQGNANRNAALDKITNLQSGAASGLAGIGGQQFGQWLQSLQASLPLIGQDTFGGSIGSNEGAGTSSSTTNGKSSSKGGGASIG